MWDYGLFSHLMHQYIPEATECRVDAPKPKKAKAISLVDLSAPFFILGVGAMLSILVFLIENLSYTDDKKKQKNDKNVLRELESYRLTRKLGVN